MFPAVNSEVGNGTQLDHTMEYLHVSSSSKRLDSADDLAAQVQLQSQDTQLL